MPIQTSYTLEQAIAFEGNLADLSIADIISKAAEDSAIDFARAVVQGTADNQCKLPTTTTQEFLGITQRQLNDTADSSDEANYTEDGEVNIVRFGRIYANCEDGCSPGDLVFYRVTAGAGEDVGALRTDSDSGDCVEIPGATWRTTATAGNLATIQLVDGQKVFDSLTSKETLTAAGAISLLTEVTLLDSTAGAMAMTLADGTEGQKKTVKFVTDGGAVTITPTNYADGTAIVLTTAGQAFELAFLGSSWTVIDDYGVRPDTVDTIETLTVAGSISVATEATLLDSTAGAMAMTLADGTEGQKKTIKFITDGGNVTITPTNYADGTTIVMTAAGQSVELLFTGSEWNVLSDYGLRPQTIDFNDTILASGAVSLASEMTLIDSTTGGQNITLADGTEGQHKIIKMIADNGDSVLTPTNLFDGTTLTFDDANDSAEMYFVGTNWLIVGTPTATLA